MSEWIKPPIGVSPHWYVYNKRIKEVSEAITRYAEFALKHDAVRDSLEDYKLIAKWAMELKLLAETEIQLLKGDKE